MLNIYQIFFYMATVCIIRQSPAGDEQAVRYQLLPPSYCPPSKHQNLSKIERKAAVECLERGIEHFCCDLSSPCEGLLKMFAVICRVFGKTYIEHVCCDLSSGWKR